jgi:hypothetical protein
MRGAACGSPAQCSRAALSNTVEIVSADGLARALPPPGSVPLTGLDPMLLDPMLPDHMPPDHMPPDHMPPDPKLPDHMPPDPALPDPTWARRRTRRRSAAAARRSRFRCATASSRRSLQLVGEQYGVPP